MLAKSTTASLIKPVIRTGPVIRTVLSVDGHSWGYVFLQLTKL